MNAMLVYMGDEQAGGEDAAIEFLSRHGDLWREWVSDDAAGQNCSSPLNFYKKPT